MMISESSDFVDGIKIVLSISNAEIARTPHNEFIYEIVLTSGHVREVTKILWDCIPSENKRKILRGSQ